MTDVMSLAVNPVTTNILYAGTVDGVFKTTNGGISWTSVGLNGLTVEALAIDPNYPGSVYAGTSGGVYKTGDGGATWYAVNWGLPGAVTGLAIDTLGDLIYAAVPDGGVYRAAINQVAGLSVTAGPRMTGLPGETITHTFTIRNTGNGVDSFDLQVASSLGWPVNNVGGATVGPIGFNVARTVQVTTTIPGGTAMGILDTLTLTATSQFDASRSDSAQASTWVARKLYLPKILKKDKRRSELTLDIKKPRL